MAASCPAQSCFEHPFYVIMDDVLHERACALGGWLAKNKNKEQMIQLS